MFLSLMRNEKISCPRHFRCINTDTVQALEQLQLDVCPLLATLDDGHEFSPCHRQSGRYKTVDCQNGAIGQFI